MYAPELTIRRARRKDLHFLTSSWLDNYRHNGVASKHIPNSIFYFTHHKIIEDLLSRATILVLCDSKDEDSIVGWVCSEVMDGALVVHYAYIKYRYRNKGLLRQLMGVLQEKLMPAAIFYTHTTGPWERIAKTHGWIYNPYLLFQGLPDDWEHTEIRLAIKDKEKQVYGEVRSNRFPDPGMEPVQT